MLKTLGLPCMLLSYTTVRSIFKMLVFRDARKNSDTLHLPTGDNCLEYIVHFNDVTLVQTLQNGYAFLKCNNKKKKIPIENYVRSIFCSYTRICI